MVLFQFYWWSKLLYYRRMLAARLLNPEGILNPRILSDKRRIFTILKITLKILFRKMIIWTPVIIRQNERTVTLFDVITLYGYVYQCVHTERVESGGTYIFVHWNKKREKGKIESTTFNISSLSVSVCLCRESVFGLHMVRYHLTP